jgi:hypothetical protein
MLRGVADHQHGRRRSSRSSVANAHGTALIDVDKVDNTCILVGLLVRTGRLHVVVIRDIRRRGTLRLDVMVDMNLHATSS